MIILRVVSDKAWTRDTVVKTGGNNGMSTFSARRGIVVETSQDVTNGATTLAGSYATQTKKSAMGNSLTSFELNDMKV